MITHQYIYRRVDYWYLFILIDVVACSAIAVRILRGAERDVWA